MAKLNSSRIYGNLIVDNTINGVGLTSGLNTFTLTSGSASLVRSGAHALTLTTIGASNVSFPTTGTLATTAGTETFTNKTLTSPRIGTSILDTNGNELILLNATASAVNELSITNAATTGAVTLSTSGGDADIGLNINTKGAGIITIGNTVTNASTTLRIGTAAASGAGVVKTIEIGTGSVNSAITYVTIGASSNGTTQILSPNTYISGNLYIDGTTTTINTQTLNVADNIITLNSDFTSGDMPTENAGIEVLRGTSAGPVSLI
jgi:hypothetical protein